MLRASKGFIFESTKTYVHSIGLSCTFRQWRATESHCRFLHGYALEVKLAFQGPDLDEKNWLADFGGLKEVKQWLEQIFDHKLVVARDDPEIEALRALAAVHGVAEISYVDHVGCEAFAMMIYNNLVGWKLSENYRYLLHSVEVREHAGNSATYRRIT